MYRQKVLRPRARLFLPDFFSCRTLHRTRLPESADLKTAKPYAMKHRFPTAVHMLAALLPLFLLNGCSVFMAANQPDRKDLSVLAAGTPRARLLEEFGQPLSSRLQGEKRIDLFSFVQGYHKGTKAARAFGHGVGDVATFGLWEFAGTSTETVFDGKKLSFEVTYNRSDFVERVVRLSE